VEVQVLILVFVVHLGRHFVALVTATVAVLETISTDLTEQVVQVLPSPLAVNLDAVLALAVEILVL